MAHRGPERRLPRLVIRWRLLLLAVLLAAATAGAEAYLGNPHYAVTYGIAVFTGILIGWATRSG